MVVLLLYEGQDMESKEISCLIGIQHMDQRVEYIYVNWDGDIHGVGRVLHSHFTTSREKVAELIMTGSRQGLHRDDIDSDGTVLSDMEIYKEAKVAKDSHAYFHITHPEYPISFYYLFTLDATWTVFERTETVGEDDVVTPVALFTNFGPFH